MAARRLGFWRRAGRGSVRFRTTVAAVAVVAVAFVVAGVMLVTVLRAVLVREADAAVSLRASEAARVWSSGGDPVAGLSGDDDTFVQLLDASGQLVGATPNAAGLPVLARLAPGESRQVTVPSDDDPFLVAAAASTGGRTVLVGQSLDAVGGSTRAVTGLLAVAMPLLLLVVGVTTWRAAGRALAPVEAIRAEVDSISTSQLHRRVPEPPGDDEIGRLAATMNRMLDRLEQASHRQRRFAADASHELRTPIATLRQHAEVALAHPEMASLEELPRTALAEAERMQGLVDDLLLLARADEDRLVLRRDAVDLDDLVLAEADRLAAAGGLDVDVRGVSPVQVQGDPSALRRLVGNLADNAARHARQRVSFALSDGDGRAELHVDDDGPGVPEAERARIFDRFVRLDDARVRADGVHGSGLGLAIVAEIAAAHSGAAEAAGSPLGGARFTVRLPTVPQRV